MEEIVVVSHFSHCTTNCYFVSNAGCGTLTSAWTHTATAVIPPGCSVAWGSAFAGHSVYLGPITFGHSHRMASVDRDNAHWGRIGVRLTGSIHWDRHNHIELAELTPNQWLVGPAQSANTPPSPSPPV